MSHPSLLKPAALDSEALDWTGRWRQSDIWDILVAARDGALPRLRDLLARDPSLARAGYWYTPPLHFAVREGHLEATRALLDAGAPLQHRCLYGSETLLQMAEDRGHADVADELRRRHAKQTGSTGTRHAIHDAVISGDPAEVRTLLAADPALVNRGDHLGRRPLHLAVESGRRDLVDLLLDAGADIDAPGFSSSDRLGGDGFRPVVSALWHHPYWRQRNDDAMARHLISRGAAYTITLAAALGDEQHVAALLADNAALANDQEKGGKRPLSAAAERNRENIVRRLIDAGADPNLPEGENCPRGHALWAAAHLGHRAVAEQLLEAGADPNAEVESSGTPTESANDPEMRALLYRYGGRVRLLTHVWQGNIDTVAAILDARPDVFDETTTADAFTHAASAGHEALLRLLLGRGLRVPAVVTGCQTYLWESPKMARLLLELGMDPNLPNWQQVRPLHHMAARGEVDRARLFLEFGADLRAVDEEYRSTPLGWAARCGQEEFVRFVLATDPDLRTSSCGEPEWAHPVQWARRRGHSEITRLLESSS